MMRDDVENLIRTVFKELQEKKGLVVVTDNLADTTTLEHSEKLEHGDYSISVALRTSDYRKAAEKIKQHVEAKHSSLLEKVEVAEPGFVNLFLSQDALLKETQKVIKEGKKYGHSAAQKKKVMVEFTDPNPFKEFHIGHLYSNIVGESLSRLFEATGAAV